MEDMEGESAPIPSLRVSQLDAGELDVELHDLLKSQLLNCFKYHKSAWPSKLDPEINAILRSVIWKFTLCATGATVGQQLLSLSYRNEKTDQWMTATRKYFYGLIGIGFPWLKDRVDDILRCLGQGHHIAQCTYIIEQLELAAKAATLVNFLIFLQRGRYMSLLERVLSIRSYFTEPQPIRQVGFEYMTRELLWHGFAEFIFFILPLVNFHKIKNFVWRHLLLVSREHREVEASRESNSRECALCGEWPMNPHEIGCAHVFCYYCIQANFEADPGFSCPLCDAQVHSEDQIQRQRHTLDRRKY